MDLSRLGHRAAGRGDRRLRAEPGPPWWCAASTGRAGASRWRWSCWASSTAPAAARRAAWRCCRCARALRLDPLQAEPVLEVLQRLDWCALLAEPGEPRHVLLVDPQVTPLAPLVERLLLADDGCSPR
ncbi:MAG: hypothetical protein U1F21_15600 [Sphaerotilus natans]